MASSIEKTWSRDFGGNRMTTLFDRIQIFLKEIKTKIDYEEFTFLREIVEGIHDYQHFTNSHEADDFIYKRLINSPFSQEVLSRIGYETKVMLHKKKKETTSE